MTTAITEQQTAVTVYSQPNCQPCRITKRALDKREITYTEVDITKDDVAAEYVRSLGHMQAPVVVTSEGEHWSGYRPDKLGELA